MASPPINFLSDAHQIRFATFRQATGVSHPTCDFDEGKDEAQRETGRYGRAGGGA